MLFSVFKLIYDSYKGPETLPGVLYIDIDILTNILHSTLSGTIHSQMDDGEMIYVQTNKCNIMWYIKW